MKHSKRDYSKFQKENASDSDRNITPKSGRKKSFFRSLLHFLWGLIIIALILTAIVTGIASGTLYSFYTELPAIERLEKFRPSLVTKVYDRNEELIGEFFIEKRSLVTYEELPEDFVNALLSVEDKRFWNHFGIDLIGFSRAIVTNIKARRFAEGASTITQQLTRLLFLSPEKQVIRKSKK